MSADKILLIYNPNAGNGMFKSNLDLIVEKFQEKGKLVVPVRGAVPALLDKVFASAREEKITKVVAAGGDGTINQVVNAMMRSGCDVPLAIFPAGTANDFAYYFDLPHDIEGMIDVALSEHYTYADVGKANEKYFVNVAALGFLVDVSQKTDPNIKNTLGVISYYLKGMSEIPNLRPISVKVQTNGETISEKIYFMLIMNGRSAGGFKRIAPAAEVNDGLLDVMMFKEMSVLDLPPLLFNVLVGDHTENENVVSFRTDKLYIEADQEVGTDVDGETGPDLPIAIELLPRAIRICTGRDNMEGTRW